MLFLSIGQPELAERVLNKTVSMELRLDLMPKTEFVKDFLQRATSPVMLTLRKKSQGGKFLGTEIEREALIKNLLALKPPFFDLEYDMRPAFLHEVIKTHPETKFILSYHHFERMPPDLEEIFQMMQGYAVFSYKFALMAHSTNDALKMLLFMKNHPKVSVICMGKAGEFARVLGKVSGNLIDYACLSPETKIAPGQLSLPELIDIYHYPSLNKNTSIYGLIGDPVEKSPGHLHHNAVFKSRGVNAVYVKMSVKEDELSQFIPLAIAMGIRGLSVTIPLKEKILPFLDKIEPNAKQIGAVNTLLFKDGKIIGTNTDGLGALDAIEKKMSVHKKLVVLLGAGGTARAIAFEAIARGANVLVLNRTVRRAEELALRFGCKAGGLDEVPSFYDIMINCTPDPMPIDPKKIRPGTLAMDVVYSPRVTPFLKEACSKRCQIVYGEEMFLNQAALQTAFWLSS